MFKYLTGDVTQPRKLPGTPSAVAHVCNNRGGWGAGVSGAIGRRWPQAERQYRSGRPAMGGSQVVEIDDLLYIVNLVAQDGYKNATNPRPCKLDALASALEEAQQTLPKDTVWHIPYLGCGLGGRTWVEVGPVVSRALKGALVLVYRFG